MFDNRELIELALKRSGGRNTFEQVIEGVASGHMQIWHAENSCLVTQLEVFASEKVLRVFLAAGDGEEVLAMTPDVAEWAKIQGCRTAEFEGRLGWEKPLSQAGWRKRFVVMELELEE